MKTREFVIHHPSQLNSLSTLPFSRRAWIGRIVLSESYHHNDKDEAEGELNKYYYACGCSQGAKGLILGLAIFGLVGLFGYYSYDWVLSKSISVFLSGAILAAIIGKLIGLVQANERLKKRIQKIQAVWSPEWSQTKILGCG